MIRAYWQVQVCYRTWYAFSRGGQPMCLYGDHAYLLRVHPQGPFKDARLTPNMLAFNESMSAVRVSVE